PLLCRNPKRSIELNAEAAELADELGDEPLRIRAQVSVAVNMAELGDYDKALATLDELATQASALRDAMLVARAQNNIAHVLGMLGRFDEAGVAARIGRDTAYRAGLSRTVGAILTCNLAESLCATGRWDEADAVCVAALDGDPVNVFAAQLRAIRGRIALVRGDVEVARTNERLARRLLDQAGAVGPHPQVAGLRAMLAMHDRRVDDAQAILEEALAVATEQDNASHTWDLLTTGAWVAADRRLRARTLADD